ncbi:TIM barrel protein [Lentzea sp. NBRC 105346]|uniref:hydroxypyruvate isomerase family protein n=1 Tax=Lentzea sp. NBRC 105346 TaxID=3032205 RepID=UPI002552DB6D|nr:TIM barrel protein [Lentzea sp. NBRC 105346]
MRFDANLSMLFTDLPLLERPAAAKAAGFDAVEIWWPFAEAVPDVRDVDRFIAAIRDAGVQLVGLNFFAGDMPAGDRGLVSWAGRQPEFRANVEVTASIARELGTTVLNALFGNFAPSDLALENLAFAADVAAEIGATVVLEPLSGAPRYPLLTARDALNVIDSVGRSNVALLADLYHLAVNGDDLDVLVTEHVDRIGHVQIADAPGRGEPGTGSLDLFGYLAKIHAGGYQGYVGAEYKPVTGGFEWKDQA